MVMLAEAILLSDEDPVCWSAARYRLPPRPSERSSGAVHSLCVQYLRCRQSRSAIRERLPDEQRAAILQSALWVVE